MRIISIHCLDGSFNAGFSPPDCESGNYQSMLTQIIELTYTVKISATVSAGAVPKNSIYYP